MTSQIECRSKIYDFSENYNWFPGLPREIQAPISSGMHKENLNQLGLASPARSDLPAKNGSAFSSELLDLTRIEGKNGGGSVGSAALLCAGVTLILGIGFLSFERSSAYMPEKDRRTFSKAMKLYQEPNAAPRVPLRQVASQ